METLTRIILASGSPRRLELLRSLGLDVAVAPSNYPEPPMPHLTPLELAATHARAKLGYCLTMLRQAQHDRSCHPELPHKCHPELPHKCHPELPHKCHPELVEGRQVVIAADTVVDVDGVALGKPRDAAEAVRMLDVLSGREHLVHTAFAIALPDRTEAVEEAETTRVRFHKLSADEIAQYVASGEPMDKAGAYGIQGRAASLVAGIDGDFYTVMGFPLGRFVRTLRRLGLAVPAAKVGS